MLAGYVAETLRIGNMGTTPVMPGGWKPSTD
jgi:hypothetical protein